MIDQNRRQPLAPSIAVAESTPPGTTHVRVAKIYSTVDGDNQYIELEIVRVGDTPLVLAGRTMTIRDRRGAARAFPLGPPKRPVLIDQLLLFERFFDDELELLDVEGLLDKIVGAKLESVSSSIHRSECRH